MERPLTISEQATGARPGRPRARRGREIAALVALALGLRLAPVAVRGLDGHLEHGYRYYLEMADNVCDGRGFQRELPYGQGPRRAIRTPLYPLALAGMRWLPGSLALWVVLLGAAAGTASALCARALGRRLFGPAAGLLAGLVTAAWPYAVSHDVALQDTALYTALFAGFLVAAWRLADDRSGAGGVAVVAGALGTLAVLTRVALLPSVVAILVWAAWRARPQWRAVALAGLVVAAGLSPWLVRNASVLGRPVLTSDTGRSLWLGNNPQTFSVYPRESIDRAEERAWLAVPPEERERARQLGARDELAADDWFRTRAVAWMRAHPGAAVLGAARKAWAAYSPWFNPVGSRLKQLVHLVSYGPVALLALAALVVFRRRWRELLPIPACALLLAFQSALFFGHSGYRAYLDPLLVVLASGLVVTLVRRRHGKTAGSGT